MDQQKDIVQPTFSFTKQLTKAIKQIQCTDGAEQQVVHAPVINTKSISGTLKPKESDLMCCFESRDFLIFALITWQGKLESHLCIYYFGKAKGEYQSKNIDGIKGKVLSMQFSFPYEVIGNKKPNFLHQPNKDHMVKLVMGSQEGFIKIMNFEQNFKVKSFQIDTKGIVDIKMAPPQKFHNNHICFALLEDYNIYTVNIEKQEVIAHFRPTLILCDVSLSISLHKSMKYLLQSTKGGYLVLWRVNENLFKRLDPSDKKSVSKQKIYNVFPTSILHSASIEGLKWAIFLGDLIALITAKGLFKILAISTQQKQQFAVLLEYQIQNGATIKDARLLQKQECLIVLRQQGSYQSILECIFYTPELQIKETLKINIDGMFVMDSFFLSLNLKYLFIRNKEKFFINLTNVICEKAQENKKRNDSLRQIIY